MTQPPSTPRTAAANQARARATENKIRQVEAALTQLRQEKTPVTYPAVARRAGVSRTFLYDSPQARALMNAACTDRPTRSRDTNPTTDPTESIWQDHALNAEAALKTAHTEIRTQRLRIGHLLGQLRDLEHELPADALQRISAENTTLKQRIRELTQNTRTLEERLQAARSNARFADRRIAQLEAEIAEHTLPPPSTPTNATDMSVT